MPPSVERDGTCAGFEANYVIVYREAREGVKRKEGSLLSKRGYILDMRGGVARPAVASLLSSPNATCERRVAHDPPKRTAKYHQIRKSGLQSDLFDAALCGAQEIRSPADPEPSYILSRRHAVRVSEEPT